MITDASVDFCNEFYEVGKAVEAVVELGGQARRIRIEALLHRQTKRYGTRAYIEEKVALQPGYPQAAGRHGRPPEDMTMWVGYPLSITEEKKSADAALSQALWLLRHKD